MIPVYFATSRVPIATGTAIAGFGSDPNPLGQVTFGKALVSDASPSADLEQPFTMEGLSTGTFWSTLQDEIVHGASSDLMVSIHGFDYKFDESIVRAAQLVQWYGAGQPPIAPAMVCLCWPSLGKLTLEDYGKDYTRATGAGDAFRQLLRALVPMVASFRGTGRPNRRVTLLAHSMGNHVLRAGLQSALGTAPGQYNPAGQSPLFDRIILAASDEDADALSHGDKLAAAGTLAGRVCVYYHNEDVPLGTISSVFHGCSRLGIHGGPDKTSFRGLNFTFINCSAAKAKDAANQDVDPTAHQYYRTVPAVRDDICGVILGTSDDKILNRTYRTIDNYYRLS